MTAHTSNTPDAKIGLILNLMPKRKPLPGEDATQMEDLEQALIAELAPATPLEHVIVDDLFNLLCDAMGHRRYRDALLRAGTEQLSAGAFHNGKIGQMGFCEINEEARQLSRDLVSDDKAAQENALAELAKRKVSVEAIIAQAFASLAQQITTHEALVADIEVRRRRLLDDLYSLKATTAKPVEDAVLVDEA